MFSTRPVGTKVVVIVTNKGDAERNLAQGHILLSSSLFPLTHVVGPA